MKRIAALFVALLFAATDTFAQEYGQARTVTIWDNATAPHDNGITTPEENREGKVRSTSQAELYLFPADKAKATGQAVVICPGGGYSNIVIRREGIEIARWFAAQGITAAVLKYRLPNGHPEVPLEDAEQALRIMTGRVPGAEGYTAEKVGIVGFSAGGHLAAMTSTMGAVRPAFSVLFYPVIADEEGLRHWGSFDKLAGKGHSAELCERYSLQNRVTDQTTPTILFLSDNDEIVPPGNSVVYYRALKRHGVRASMHIYPVGGHGWAFQERFPYKAACQQALADWLARLP